MASFIKTITRQPKGLIANALRSYSSEIPKYETLAVSEPKPHVFHVELNRPQKLNTFNIAMWRELRECFAALSQSPDCRVVVLSAQGKHFTGGIDLFSLMELGQRFADTPDVARKSKILYQMIKDYQDSITSLEDCVKPVLSVVHSACVGAGVDLITAADMRYCTEDAWFQVKEVDIGMAADVGTLQRLPKVIGSTSVARDLCFTGRKFDSKEALSIGLVSKVYPDKESALEEVMQVAVTIASKSPVAVQTTKQSIIYSQNKTNKKGLEHIVSAFGHSMPIKGNYFAYNS